MLGLDVEYATEPVIMRIRTPIISYHFPNFYLTNGVSNMLGNYCGRERQRESGYRFRANFCIAGSGGKGSPEVLREWRENRKTQDSLQEN